MEHYGLALPFDGAGFFATEHHQKVIKQMKAAIQAGRLVALSGLVGSGKTVLMRQLQEELVREGKVLIAKSLSVDKERVTLQTLMMALFFDLSPEDGEPWIPSQGERRERELRDLISSGIAAGEFRPVDPNTVATTLAALYEGLVLLWFVDREAIQWETQGTESVRLLLDGLRP